MLTINVNSLVKHSGLPGARSEISGPNVYKISGHFCWLHEAQNTENARFFCPHKRYSLKQISTAVLKMLLRHCYEHTNAKM